MMNKTIINQDKLTLLALLLCIILISLFAVKTYSKYVGESGDDTDTKIAKWDVSLDTSGNQSDSLSMTIGNTTQSYVLRLVSVSEVKAKYSIVLSDLPNDLMVKLDNGQFQSVVNNTITFSDVGYINADAQTRYRTHTMTFSVPIDSSPINASEINVSVVFDQDSVIGS